MAADAGPDLKRELCEVKGGLDLLSDLREEFEQWVEEAQDESKQEALENVLGHIEAIEDKYRSRQEELMARQKRA